MHCHRVVHDFKSCGLAENPTNCRKLIWEIEWRHWIQKVSYIPSVSPLDGLGEKQH